MVRPLILGFACLTATSWALAQGTAPQAVELDASECVGVPYDRASLLELLRVELGALGVERVVPTGSEKLSVRLSITPAGCDPNTTELLLAITRAGATGTKERRMPLADVPVPNRSRALAIALAELFREPDAVALPVAIPAEKPAKTPLAPVVTTPVFVPVTPFVPPRAVAPWLGGGAVMRTFPSESIAVFGVEGLVALPVVDDLRLSLGIDAQTGQAGASTHSTTVGAVTAFVGVGWMLGTVTQLELGPRLHVGYGWAQDVFQLTGDPNSDHLVLLGTLAGTVHIGLERELHGHIGLEIGAGLLDAAVLDKSLVDDRGEVSEIGAVIELGARLGVDYEL